MQHFFDYGLGGGVKGLLVALVVSAALAPLGIRLAWRLGIVDRPAGDKIHARTTPLMGGVAMALAFLAVSLLWVQRNDQWGNGELLALLLGAFLAAALGLADEVWKLAPRWHFLGQVAVVLVSIGAGFPLIRSVSIPWQNFDPAHPTRVDFSLVTHFGPVLAGLVGILFTVFWIVGMMNTINFLDGLDGLAGGVSAIAAGLLGIWAVVVVYNGYPPTHQNQNVVLPLILCGAILGFLPYNWSPARVFMGDSGAMFIGFSLGALSIFGPVKFGTALLILIVPILDVAWAIVRRLLGRRSFASGDKHHIYHRMLELGMSRRAVVLSFYALCLVLGVIDLTRFKREKVVAIAVVGVLATIGAVALEIRGRRAAELVERRRADAM